MTIYEDLMQKVHAEIPLTVGEAHWFRETVQRLRRGLLFYANAQNFYVSGGQMGVVQDCGEIAREALKPLNEEGHMKEPVQI